MEPWTAGRSPRRRRRHSARQAKMEEDFDIDKFIFNATVEALRERGYPEEDAVKRAEELLSLPGFWKTFGDVV